MDFAKRDGTQNDERDGNNFFVNFGTFGCTFVMVCACWPNIGTVTLTISTPIKSYVSYVLSVILLSTNISQRFIKKHMGTSGTERPAIYNAVSPYKTCGDKSSTPTTTFYFL